MEVEDRTEQTTAEAECGPKGQHKTGLVGLLCGLLIGTCLGMILYHFLAQSSAGCTVSTNVTEDMDCSKSYAHGDTQHSQCKWGYDEHNGPLTWHNWWPDCRGSAQSPIDIELDKVETSNAGSFVFEVFQDNPAHPTRQAISGGHFPAGVRYQLIQAHWHWGVNNSVGSEHVVEGTRYPMEIHMVHYNEKYLNKDEAFQHPDGVAVNTFLYKLSQDDNPGLSKLMTFIKQMPDLTVDHPIDVKAEVKFEDLFPLHMDHRYFYYNGSFTTPPCSQVVSWTVFNTTETISQAQLDIFRTLKNKDGKLLGSIFRPLQPLNGRKVFTSKFYGA
eukprot:GFUD01135414.1.p1 GENE.GFUD01135414.1~~GFUD01135414.1.p1  ORF type:complete len:329 (-),score=90.11 GFUD01135414.1:93-1079(-)